MKEIQVKHATDIMVRQTIGSNFWILFAFLFDTILFFYCVDTKVRDNMIQELQAKLHEATSCTNGTEQVIFTIILGGTPYKRLVYF